MTKLKEYETKYEQEYSRLKIEINELERQKDNKKSLLENIGTKLKAEIERVHKELKL